MLFKRRNKEPLSSKLGNLLWPRMGWRRVVDYYKHRTIRIPASEYAIASGVAFGCLVSWTPTFGTHLLQCLVFCWLFRSNFFAAFVGSALGNFWTTPLMMYISYQAGKAILLTFGLDEYVMHYQGNFSWDVVQEQGWKAFLPTLIGGYTMGIITYPLFYYPTYYMVKGARLARRKLVERKVHKEAVQITGQGQ